MHIYALCMGHEVKGRPDRLEDHLTVLNAWQWQLVPQHGVQVIVVVGRTEEGNAAIHGHFQGHPAVKTTLRPGRNQDFVRAQEIVDAAREAHRQRTARSDLDLPLLQCNAEARTT